MESHRFFLLGFCFLLVHEMDAVRCQEWRIVFGLNRMGEQAGYHAFTALHVPLYAVLLWGLFESGDLNRGLVVGLDLFLVAHLALHVLLRNLAENLFRSAFSWAVILGAGLCGAIDLLLL